MISFDDDQRSFAVYNLFFLSSICKETNAENRKFTFKFLCDLILMERDWLREREKEKAPMPGALSKMNWNDLKALLSLSLFSTN